MNTLLLTSLTLLACLWLCPNYSTGKKVKCYKVYKADSNTCRKRMKGRMTQKDCCGKNGGASYQVIKRRGKKTQCMPCTVPTKKGPIVENWSAWSKWGKCNSPCGPGIARRTRQCLDLKNIGCPGGRSEKRKCVHPTKLNCPINGAWSSWGNWSACSVSCGKGRQLRFRSCTNPKPQYGGRDCSGLREEKQNCVDTPHCPINGGWGSWGRWTACSVTCDIGLRKRKRNCDNPKPKYGGKPCDPAKAVESQSCDTYKPCDGSGSGASGSGASGDSSGDNSGSGDGSASGSGAGDDSSNATTTAKPGSDFDFGGSSTAKPKTSTVKLTTVKPTTMKPTTVKPTTVKPIRVAAT